MSCDSSQVRGTLRFPLAGGTFPQLVAYYPADVLRVLCEACSFCQLNQSGVIPSASVGRYDGVLSSSGLTLK